MREAGSDAAFEGVIGRYLHESIPWWPRPVEAEEGSPNFLIIVLDDVGFAHLGCYGSPIETPNMDRLAEAGVRYTNFHVPPVCAASRASLLTGRNHHSVGMGNNPNWNSGFPPRPGRDLARGGDPGAAAAVQRLQHLRGRQVAPGPDRRDIGGRALPQLAAAEGLRALLRIPRFPHRSL